MLEHDARAYARASFEHDAPAYATDGRTDGLTQKCLRDDESCGFVTRAGGLKESSTGSTQNPARPCLSTYRPEFTFTGLPVPLYPVASPLPLAQIANAQGYAGAPLTRGYSASCTNSATRRTESAFVADPRLRFTSEAVRSPVARWHGSSDGSDPLRPPANRPAASRESRLRSTRFYSPTPLKCGHRNGVAS